MLYGCRPVGLAGIALLLFAAAVAVHLAWGDLAAEQGVAEGGAAPEEVQAEEDVL